MPHSATKDDEEALHSKLSILILPDDVSISISEPFRLFPRKLCKFNSDRMISLFRLVPFSGDSDIDQNTSTSKSEKKNISPEKADSNDERINRTVSGLDVSDVNELN